MIIDKLKNAPIYFSLNEKFAKALLYLQSVDYNNLQPGKYEIEGTDIYALVQQYWTGEKKEQLEVHRRYADIHYIVHGTEVIGAANIDDLIAGEYDAASDYVAMKGAASFFAVREGSFAIFHPQDAHMPGIASDAPQFITKIVMKVLVAD